MTSLVSESVRRRRAAFAKLQGATELCPECGSRAWFWRPRPAPSYARPARTSGVTGLAIFSLVCLDCGYAREPESIDELGRVNQLNQLRSNQCRDWPRDRRRLHGKIWRRHWACRGFELGLLAACVLLVVNGLVGSANQTVRDIMLLVPLTALMPATGRVRDRWHGRYFDIRSASAAQL